MYSQFMFFIQIILYKIPTDSFVYHQCERKQPMFMDYIYKKRKYSML